MAIARSYLLLAAHCTGINMPGTLAFHADTGPRVLMCTQENCTRRMASTSGAVVVTIGDTGRINLTITGQLMWSVGPFEAAGSPYALTLRPSGDLVLLANGFVNAVWASGSACRGAGGYYAQVCICANRSLVLPNGESRGLCCVNNL